MGLSIGFGSHPRYYIEVNWFNKGWILAACCSQVLFFTIGANRQGVSQSGDGNNEADHG